MSLWLRAARQTRHGPLRLQGIRPLFSRFSHSKSEAEAAVNGLISHPPSDPLERRKREVDVLRKISHAGDSEKTRELLELALDHSEVKNPGVLHGFFTSKPPPPASMAALALAKYNQLAPKTQILPEAVTMIPFRQALYRADFAGALKIMEQTVGAKSHLAAFTGAGLRKTALMWSVGVVAIIWGVDALLRSGLVGDWDPSRTVMVCAMVMTYLAALTVYGSMAFAGSRAGVGTTLEWMPGTSMIYRYRRMPELKMASLMAEINRSLPENLGEYSPQLLEDLKKLNLKPTETRSEQLFKEYWARGGEGFDWVEPDQDPADIIWRQEMEKSRPLRIGSPYVRTTDTGKQLEWADDVERWRNNKSIPHASLLQVDSLRTPEAMEKLEEDLKRLAADAKRAANARKLGSVGVVEEGDGSHKVGPNQQ